MRGDGADSPLDVVGGSAADVACGSPLRSAFEAGGSSGPGGAEGEVPFLGDVYSLRVGAGGSRSVGDGGCHFASVYDGASLRAADCSLGHFLPPSPGSLAKCSAIG